MVGIEQWENQIHQGDVIETLQEMPESSVHCVMTSPPYWNLRDYDHDDQLGVEETSEEFVQNLADVFDELMRVLRPDGSLWLNLGDTYQNKDLQLVPERVALEMQSRGWILRNQVTWAKPNAMPQSVKDRLNDTTEAIFHFVKQKKYYYDLDAIRKAHTVDDADRTNRDEWVKSTEANHNSTRAGGHMAGKNPGDVFEVTTKPFPETHFAVYPPELCEKPIKASCPPTVCADCGTPYERETVEQTLWEQNPEDVSRPQAKRALELAEQAGLTDEHMAAARSVNIGDADGSTGNPYDRVSEETARLARETKEALGSYYREFAFSGTETTDSKWVQTCECDTDETKPGIVLDPFSGAGTTCLVGKELGRRFVGIELNPEYVAMAQKRVGVTVDEPERLLEDGETALTAYTDGGDA